MEEEIWKDIEGYEGLYAVSTYGHVKSSTRNVKTWNGYRPIKEHLLKPKMNKLGFLEVKLSKDNKAKGFMVANLVARAFLPTNKKCNKVINIDGDKTNNHYKNLRWVYDTEQKHIMYNRGHRKNKGTGTNISYHGEGYKTYSELAQCYLVNPQNFCARLNQGWTFEEALKIKIDKNNFKKKPKFYKYYDKPMTLKQLAQISNLKINTLKYRLKNKWSVEEAVEIPILKMKGE